MIRNHVRENSARSPQWFDSAHQADILAAFDTVLAAGLHERPHAHGHGHAHPHGHSHAHGHGHSGPRPERVRELGQLAASSALPARAALLRWGALPGSVRNALLTGWYGSQRSSTAA